MDLSVSMSFYFHCSVTFNLHKKLQRRIVISVLSVSAVFYLCTFFPPLQTKLYFIEVGFGAVH